MQYTLKIRTEITIAIGNIKQGVNSHHQI